MLNLGSITANEANRHFEIVRSKGLHRGNETAIKYFLEEVQMIRKRLIEERAMDPKTDEFDKILIDSRFAVPGEYFEWLEGVLAYQLAYLFALEHP